MAAPIIGTKGAQLDLLIRQGATFGSITTTVKNSVTQAPVDLNGYTIRGQIRKTASGMLQEGAVASSQIIDAEQGIFAFWFTAEATRALVADSVSEDAPASQYVWDMEMESSDGMVQALMYGDVKVFREVTKDEEV